MVFLLLNLLRHGIVELSTIKSLKLTLNPQNKAFRPLS